MRKINYRAVHAKTLWRKVKHHASLEAAINGKDGAAGLFARTTRINYGTHGDPPYVAVWEDNATGGFVLKPVPAVPWGMRKSAIPIADVIITPSLARKLFPALLPTRPVRLLHER